MKHEGRSSLTDQLEGWLLLFLLVISIVKWHSNRSKSSLRILPSETVTGLLDRQSYICHFSTGRPFHTPLWPLYTMMPNGANSLIAWKHCPTESSPKTSSTEEYDVIGLREGDKDG